MNVKFTVRVLGFILLVATGAMILPLIVALHEGTRDNIAFALSVMTGLLCGMLMLFTTRKCTMNTGGIREGICITVFSWVIVSMLGAMPYNLCCDVGYTDAFFEAMSGFTTTGATIFEDIEALPDGILLWRSLTHLMGGMGIIVLSLAVLPFLGVSGMEMYKAEVPGVTAGKVTPRLHQTALRLWLIYIMLALCETVLLMIGGMTLFDAFCHSCSTLATGGFSTKNASIAHFTSPYIQWVIIIFMFLSGVNFSLYFLIPKKKITEIFSDDELRGYIRVVTVATIAIMISLYVTEHLGGLEYILRHTCFTVVSVITTTGFVTEDFDKWPQFARVIIILLMFTGACGGSTGGGCKVSRFQIMYREFKSEAVRLLHPRAIITPSMNGQPLTQDTINSCTAFFVLYMMMLCIGTLIMSAFGIDVLTSFTGVLTCLSNVGPGLDYLGAQENFAWLPSALKWLLSFLMLAGRLELFAVILLLMPKTYSR